MEKIRLMDEYDFRPGDGNWTYDEYVEAIRKMIEKDKMPKYYLIMKQESKNGR